MTFRHDHYTPTYPGEEFALSPECDVLLVDAQYSCTILVSDSRQGKFAVKDARGRADSCPFYVRFPPVGTFKINLPYGALVFEQVGGEWKEKNNAKPDIGVLQEEQNEAAAMWVRDRADYYYRNDSGERAAFDDIISGLANGEHLKALAHGELEGLEGAIVPERWVPVEKSRLVGGTEYWCIVGDEPAEAMFWTGVAWRTHGLDPRLILERNGVLATVPRTPGRL